MTYDDVSKSGNTKKVWKMTFVFVAFHRPSEEDALNGKFSF